MGGYLKTCPRFPYVDLKPIIYYINLFCVLHNAKSRFSNDAAIIVLVIKITKTLSLCMLFQSLTGLTSHMLCMLLYEPQREQTCYGESESE